MTPNGFGNCILYLEPYFLDQCLTRTDGVLEFGSELNLIGNK